MWVFVLLVFTYSFGFSFDAEALVFGLRQEVANEAAPSLASARGWWPKVFGGKEGARVISNGACTGGGASAPHSLEAGTPASVNN